jgi:hypothetical protein
MAYYIFLKSLTSLEEFRKNPHVKIPPKSPCANFYSLGIFKKSNFIRKRISPSLSASWPAQPSARPNRPPSSSSRTNAGCARCCRRPASRRLHGRPDASNGREKRPHLIPLHFPTLIGAIPNHFNPGNRRLQPRH